MDLDTPVRLKHLFAAAGLYILYVVMYDHMVLKGISEFVSRIVIQ